MDKEEDKEEVAKGSGSGPPKCPRCSTLFIHARNELSDDDAAAVAVALVLSVALPLPALLV